jgi:hypothetical protein
MIAIAVHAFWPLRPLIVLLLGWRLLRCKNRRTGYGHPNRTTPM